MGENRVVTEFADVADIGSSNYKSWMKRHEDDIMCASTYLPQTLVTGSYSGELVFWRMETGQPYGMYNVSNPTERIKMKYQRKTGSIKHIKSVKSRQSSNRLSTPSKFGDTATPAIFAILCLTARPVLPDSGGINKMIMGTLVVAVDDGMIQIWSTHAGGGFIAEFQSTHRCGGDYVVSLATDANNEYLFTGHMQGYIKTWHLVNFCVPEEDKVYVVMPLLRLKFPFMWKDFLLGRAKRAHRSNVPILLSSIRCHLKAVTGIIYVDEVEMLISSSSDGSARIWTLGGRYMGTLGTFKPWIPISSIKVAGDTRDYHIPADIHRSASFTTIRVMSGGTNQRKLTKKQQQQQFELMSEESKVYGKRVDLNNILGKYFKLPPRGFQHYDIVLDKSLPDVPIYAELIMPMPEKMERPPTPPLVKTINAQQRLTKAQICVPDQIR